MIKTKSPGLGFRGQEVRNGIRARKNLRIFCPWRAAAVATVSGSRRISSELARAMYAAQNHAIGQRQRFRQRVLKCSAAHGIGPRLKDRPQFAIWPAQAGRLMVARIAVG